MPGDRSSRLRALVQDSSVSAREAIADPLVLSRRLAHNLTVQPSRGGRRRHRSPMRDEGATRQVEIRLFLGSIRSPQVVIFLIHVLRHLRGDVLGILTRQEGRKPMKVSAFGPARSSVRSVTGVLVAGLVMTIPIATSARATAQESQEERFTAFAAVTGGTRSTINIVITRWTTDAEREQLGMVLLEEGSEELGEALQKQEAVGFIQMTGRLRCQLRYSRQAQVGDTRQIILAADRRISFAETRTVGGQRFGEYNISVVELRLDESGDGEGAVAPAVQIRVITYLTDHASVSSNLRPYPFRE